MRFRLYCVFRDFIWAFHADKSGIAVAYVAAALPVLIGFSLLAIDVGRLSTLQSSLQHGADALALAGAGELDRSPTAIDRANLAIQNLVTTNKSLFAITVVTINSSDITSCYLDTLPTSDATSTGLDATPPNCLATNNATNRAASSQIAHYVQVKVKPANFSTIFPATFLGKVSNSSSSAAEAVAGFDAAVCNFTPLFMCNPLEPANNSSLTDDFGLAAMASNYTRRRQIIRFLAFTGGANVTAVSGQFGFLNVAGGGANALGDQIASTTPAQCYILNTLLTKTGSMTSLRDAFNVRFDLYKGSYTASSYPPSINVRKGYSVDFNTSKKGVTSSNDCSQNQSASSTTPTAIGMPVDSCFANNSCSPNLNIGNGDWAYDPDNSPNVSGTVAFRNSGAIKGYWDYNFGTGATLPVPATGIYSNANPPSRYDLYRYEISSGYYSRYSPNGATSSPVPGNNFTISAETGRAACATSTSVSPVDTSIGTTGVDRRVIFGAIMNCAANGLQPGSNGTYHALAFGKFFLVRPVSSTNTLWTELIDLVYPGDGTGVARDRVQLYR